MINPVRATPTVLDPKSGDDSSEGNIGYWMDDPPPSPDTGVSSTGGPSPSASLTTQYVDFSTGSGVLKVGTFATG